MYVGNRCIHRTRRSAKKCHQYTDVKNNCFDTNSQFYAEQYCL